MKHKSEVIEKLKRFLSTVNYQTNDVVKTIQSDCGLEYKNGDVSAILKSLGIKHKTSIPYIPQQN